MLVLRHVRRLHGRVVRPVLTLGNFDGVHVGHQAILRRLGETARDLGGEAAVLTFEPHPIAVLAPQRTPLRLSDWRLRMEQLDAVGHPTILVERFTPALAMIEAEDFVRHWLVEGLGVRALVVGHRVRFGHDRRGDGDLLLRLGRQLGIDVEIVGPVETEGHLISSSAIREAIRTGDLALARTLLGRAPTVGGRVIHGHHRGRQLGFPTANLRLRGVALPPDGVYAARARTRGTWHPAVVNLGFNPTFSGTTRTLEVHLLDFEGDLYGQRIDVALEEGLRGERKFPSVEALVAQIREDAAAARRRLIPGP